MFWLKLICHYFLRIIILPLLNWRIPSKTRLFPQKKLGTLWVRFRSLPITAFQFEIMRLYFSLTFSIKTKNSKKSWLLTIISCTASSIPVTVYLLLNRLYPQMSTWRFCGCILSNQDCLFENGSLFRHPQFFWHG